MPTNSDLVTDLPADFEVFGQGVDTTLADLKGGTTGQILSKASNTDMDFTWTNLNPGDITGVTATSPLTGGGTSGDVTIGIQAASTSQSGAVQLTDSTSSTSTSTAATPNSVKTAYDLANTANSTANAAIPKSLVDAKGDIVTATADNTPSRLAVGTDGYLLTADSTAANGIKWAAAPATGFWKNPVLNSNMSVWQRGTSMAGSGSAFSADRWQSYRSVAGSTFSRQATGDTTNLPNIQYCVRMSRDSGNTSTANIALIQNFETVNSIPFAGKTITYSFYARKGANYSAASSALNVEVTTGTGTDQNLLSGFTGAVTAIGSTATLTTTWQRFTFTATLNSNITQIGLSTYFTPVGTAGAADYVEITGFQLEVGSSATAYYPNGNTYQAELAACQRYYQRVTGNASNTAYNIFGIAASATRVFCSYAAPVMFRSTPSVAQSSAYIGNTVISNQSITSISNYSNGGLTQISLDIGVGSGLTAGNPYFIALPLNAYLELSAEL